MQPGSSQLPPVSEATVGARAAEAVRLVGVQEPAGAAVGVEQQPGSGTPTDAERGGEPQGSWLSVALALLGAMVLSMTVLRIFLRQRAAASQAKPSPGERLSQIRSDAARRREPLEELMADAVELTNRLAAQLDNRAERLEQLMGEANAVAERLERAAERVDRSQPAGPRAPSQSPSRGVETSPEAIDLPDRSHAEIYRLADEGLDPGQIAQRTGQPRGQVELVLALRRA